MILSILSLLALSGDAHAWSHTQKLWSRDEMPLPYYFADIDEDSIDMEYAVTAVDESWGVWTGDGASCAQLEATNTGVRSGWTGGFNNDGFNTFTFEDPAEDLDPGVLAATLCFPGERAFDIDGNSYYFSADCDIVYSSTVDWGKNEDIDAGACASEYSLKAVTTHELGHLWGLGHSCDDPNDDGTKGEESCELGDLRDAIMFWSTGPCDNGPEGGFTSDDITGLYALYGPYCSFEAVEGADRRGGTGMEVCFQATCNEDPTSILWAFGDGETYEPTEEEIAAGEPVCHTYNTKGQFSVNLTITGEGDACGEWEYTQRNPAYVLTCGEPEPAEGFSGLFTYTHYDGLVYQMVNQVDTSVYGCVELITWEVYEGGSVSGEPIISMDAWSPKIEFPGEGTYTVVVNVGGPGGLKANALTIEAVDEKGEATSACSTVPFAAGFAGVFVALAGAVRRRRS